MRLSRYDPVALTSVLGVTLVLTATAADCAQWRGPERNGVSRETGLLPEWPPEGPKLLWTKSDLGAGYAAPAVAGDRLYVLGNEGIENEFVQAIDVRDGHRVWSTRLGNVGNPKQNPNMPAARSTPTVDGECLFALGSDGDLACLEVGTGKARWQKSLRVDFGGKPGEWAYAESPLLDGDTLVCTPGGDAATVVALRKQTGEIIWKAALPEAGEAAYASAVVVEAGGVRQYVQLLQKGLFGVDAQSGRLLWRYGRAVSRFNANIPSPLAAAASVYWASAGTGAGAVKLVSRDDRVEIEEVYFEAKLPTAIGGAVKVDEYLYGTTAQAMLCVDFATGQVKWEERGLGAASLCYADGRLYLHGESGEAGLVEPSPQGYREKGRFAPPDQPKRSSPMEKAWAYPVVSNGRFYLRDHGQLWCYDVKANR